MQSSLYLIDDLFLFDAIIILKHHWNPAIAFHDFTLYSLVLVVHHVQIETKHTIEPIPGSFLTHLALNAL
jgi:hypothetical protein